MMVCGGVRFALVLLADFALATCFGLIPLRKYLQDAEHEALPPNAYDVLKNSNLDIVLAVLLRCIVYAGLYFWSGKLDPVFQGQDQGTARTRGTIFTMLFHHTIQLGILAKMVVVAAHGDAGMLPDAMLLHPGILAIFGSCLIFLILGYIEKWMMMKIMRGAKIPGRMASNVSVREPLLNRTNVGDKRHTNKELLYGLLKFLFQDSYPIIAAMVSAFLAAIAEASVPFFTGRAIEFSAINPHQAQFSGSLVALAFVALASGIFAGIRGGVLEYTAARMSMRIRTKFFYHLLQQELGFFDTSRTGDLMSRLQTDIGATSDMVSQNINAFVRSLLHMLVLVSFMLVTCWRLTVVSFVLIPFTGSVVKFYGYYFAQFHKEIQTEVAAANSIAAETLSSITTVRAHAGEESSMADFKSKMKAYCILRKRLAIYFSGWVGFMTWAPKVVTAIVLYLGGFRVMDGKMSPGDLVAFMLYQQALAQQFNGITEFMNPIAQAIGAIEKVLVLMKRRPKVGSADGLVPSGCLAKIEMRNVTFRYPSRPTVNILNGMSLVVEPGEFVAMIGPSGCGKSSVFKLLERFYLPNSGDVIIDGREIGVYDPRWLKQSVGFVDEAPTLFPGSIRDNLLYGMDVDPGYMQEEVEAACQMANLSEFVMSLPDGVDTDCGERGVQLSGVQIWKVAVARALVRKPSILLMEDTAYLDFGDEGGVEEVIARCAAGRSLFMATTSVRVAQMADRILVVKDGMVVDSGDLDYLTKGGARDSTEEVQQQEQMSEEGEETVIE
ncbi:hypothetical protein BSKO_03050 [Bryopsis sp. KO-2023]|nr:hypothetical protein BSKO_03050 [Bryopsis sp. KO-2023]